MAISLNSPGVFTREIDNTRNLGATPQIPGPAVIGPTEKGPAFVPTTISSVAEYRSWVNGEWCRLARSEL